MMHGYNNVMTQENFELAFRRLQTVPMSAYKQLYINDLRNFGLDLDVNVESLIASLKTNIYQPSKASKFYVPKENGLVRPFSLLSFEDLLIYQAIMNVIAEAFYPDMEQYYDHMVFGNLYNNSSDGTKIFFYRKWQDQWKRFEKTTVELFKRGYGFISDFDLASFYDTVDHHLLRQILSRKLERDVVELLITQLNTWTSDFEKDNLGIMHGLPQGPSPSAFLAEICLMEIDKNMWGKMNGKRDVVYLRYADDIRLFTKDEITARRYIAYLDILARDTGFVPQANKIAVHEISDVSDILKHRNNFSGLAAEYKKSGCLSKKNNSRLTTKIKSNLESGIFDKTILRFGLYRIAADDDIKNLLIGSSHNLMAHFDTVCFYLSKHYGDDPTVKQWASGILRNRQVFYHFQIANVFRHFSHILEYDQKVFDALFNSSEDNHWYVRHFMLDWLALQNSEKLLLIDKDNNAFVNRRLKMKQFYTLTQVDNKLDLVYKMVQSWDVHDALAGWNLLFFNIPDELLMERPIPPSAHSFVQRILSLETTKGYIELALEKKGVPADILVFFSKVYWPGEEYDALADAYIKAEKQATIDPSAWLLYIDTFNHMVTAKVFEVLQVPVGNVKEYDNLLQTRSLMKDNFPTTYKVFHDLHQRRNQTTPAHPYTQSGGYAKGVNYYELQSYVDDERRALLYLLSRFEVVLGMYEAATS